jgi:hypothetical protein
MKFTFSTSIFYMNSKFWLARILLQGHNCDMPQASQTFCPFNMISPPLGDQFLFNNWPISGIFHLLVHTSFVTNKEKTLISHYLSWWIWWCQSRCQINMGFNRRRHHINTFFYIKSHAVEVIKFVEPRLSIELASTDYLIQDKKNMGNIRTFFLYVNRTNIEVKHP